MSIETFSSTITERVMAKHPERLHGDWNSHIIIGELSMRLGGVYCLIKTKRLGIYIRSMSL
jgi:hypothetical protein